MLIANGSALWRIVSTSDCPVLGDHDQRKAVLALYFYVGFMAYLSDTQYQHVFYQKIK